MEKAKICKDCCRLVPLDTEVCPCGGEDFDSVFLTPPWDSVDPYSENDALE